jgi:hypothetical protein
MIRRDRMVEHQDTSSLKGGRRLDVDWRLISLHLPRHWPDRRLAHVRTGPQCGPVIPGFLVKKGRLYQPRRGRDGPLPRLSFTRWLVRVTRLGCVGRVARLGWVGREVRTGPDGRLLRPFRLDRAGCAGRLGRELRAGRVVRLGREGWLGREAMLGREGGLVRARPRLLPLLPARLPARLP